MPDAEAAIGNRISKDRKRRQGNMTRQLGLHRGYRMVVVAYDIN